MVISSVGYLEKSISVKNIYPLIIKVHCNRPGINRANSKDKADNLSEINLFLY